MRALFQRVNEYRNTSLAIKYINRLKAKEVFERALKPLINEGRQKRRKSTRHWAFGCEYKALRALRWYRSLRKLKKVRKAKADRYRMI